MSDRRRHSQWQNFDPVTAIHDNVATKQDLELIQATLKADISVVKGDIRGLEHRLTLRGITALVTGLGILFAALHQWPPHLTP